MRRLTSSLANSRACKSAARLPPQAISLSTSLEIKLWWKVLVYLPHEKALDLRVQLLVARCRRFRQALVQQIYRTLPTLHG